MTVSELPDLKDAQEPSLSDIELLVSLRKIPALLALDRLDNFLLASAARLIKPSLEEFSPIDLNSILEAIVALLPPATLH